MMIRTLCWVTLWAAVLVVNMAAETIQVQVTDLGSNNFRYDYSITGGFLFQQNDELAIQFDASVYGSISNPVANSDFSAIVLQVNNPPGSPGVYSAQALVNNPSLSGPFSVDFTLLPGEEPGPQLFDIGRFGPGGRIVLERGSTQFLVPEPSSFSLALLGLMLTAGLSWAHRRIVNG